MKLAIIEDEQVHGELLASYLEEWGAERSVSLCIKAFASAESFLFVWEEEWDFDVLFIDIQMKEMNGMELAKRIREQDPDIVIIFTTGLPEYMEEGYEVEALHYLLKPISHEKLEQCMDRALKRGIRDRFLLVQTREEILKLSVERILYVEARGHGCVMEYLSQTGKTYLAEITESISDLEQKLGDEDFVKCHRSYLCRTGSIQRIDKSEIVLDNGSRVPVSRRLYGQVNQAFIQYFRREKKIRQKGDEKAWKFSC